MTGQRSWIGMRTNTADADAMWERLKGDKIPEFLRKMMVNLGLKARQIMVPKMRVHKGPYPDGTGGGSHKSSVGIFDTVPGPGWIVGPSMEYSKYVLLGTRYMKGDFTHLTTLNELKNAVPSVAEGTLAMMRV